MTRSTAMVGVNRNATQQMHASGASPSHYCEEREMWDAKSLGEWLSGIGVPDARPLWFEYQHEPLEVPASLVRDLHRDGVAGILPGLEYAVEGAAHLALAMGLPGAGVEAARTLRNKALLRETTSSYDWGSVAYLLATSSEELSDFLARQADSAIVKPIDRQGSLGVARVDRHSDGPALWNDILSAFEKNQTITGWSGQSRALVEELLVGDECSVEALVSDGSVQWVNLTAKHVLDGPHRVEIGHEIVTVEDWCLPVMQELASAIGFEFGLLHAEFMRTAQGPRLIECAGRPPGDQILNLIEHAWGFSPTAAWSAIMCGDSFAFPSRARGRASVAFIYADVDGEIVSDVDASLLSPEYVSSYTGARGDIVHLPRSSWDRLGFVVSAEALGARGLYDDARERADRLRPRVECGMLD